MKKFLLCLIILICCLSITSCSADTPYIGENGNWWVGDTDLGVSAQGQTGDQGLKGEVGVGISSIDHTSTDGAVDTYTITYTNGETTTFTVTNGADGIQGIQGVQGEDGRTPVITIQDGYWYVDSQNTMQSAQGIKGDPGNGISDISLTGSAGRIDTYTITFTNGETSLFTVTNGADGIQGIQGIQGVKGEDGHTPVITIQDGYWYVDSQNTMQSAQGIKGDPGNGISDISLTDSEGRIDTYTITFTNGETSLFTVTNGADGIQGIQGVKGEDGRTPIITIQNGKWHVDGNDTGVCATYLNCIHSYGEYVTDLETLCDAAGLKHRICELCGFSEYSPIEAVGHTTDDETVYLDNCVTTIVISHCGTCNKDIVEQRASAGHSYQTVEFVDAKCYIDGLDIKKCTKCNDTLETVLPASFRHVYEGACIFCGDYPPTEGIIVEYLSDSDTNPFLEEDGYYITGYEGDIIEQLYLPSIHYTEEHGYGAVIGIAPSAFNDVKNFDTVYFSSSIKYVCSEAFWSSEGGRTYHLNDGLEEIHAFGLGQINSDLYIPASVKAVDTCFAFDIYQESYLIFEGDMPDFIAGINSKEDNNIFNHCIVIFSPEREGWPTENGTTLYGGVLYDNDYARKLSYSYNDDTLEQAKLAFELVYDVADKAYGKYNLDYTMLRIVTDNEQYEEFKELALQITASSVNDDERIMAIYNWVSENIEYDFDYIMATPYDSLVARKGGCVQYATIMAQLLRALDIPALIVEGYLWSFYYPNSMKYIDENYGTIDGNHAWVIAHNGWGWSTYDPTNSQYGRNYEDFGYMLLSLRVEGLAVTGHGFYPYRMTGWGELYTDGEEWFLTHDEGYNIPIKGYVKEFYENNIDHDSGPYAVSIYETLVTQCDYVSYAVWFDRDGNRLSGLCKLTDGRYVYVFENGRVYEGEMQLDGETIVSMWDSN